MPRFQSRNDKRLHWRVIVQSGSTQDGSRGGPKMAWHLVECADPMLDTAHCVEGRLRLTGGNDPDGHCLVDDVCPRCAMLDAAQQAVLTQQADPSVAATNSAEPDGPIASNGDPR